MSKDGLSLRVGKSSTFIKTNYLTHRSAYVELDEEFKVSDSDWKWLLSHTDYTEGELNDMLYGNSDQRPNQDTTALLRFQRRVSRRRDLPPPV